MPKKVARLTGAQIAQKVRKVREDGGGVFSTGGADGLVIQVNADSASWVLRYRGKWIVLGLYDGSGGARASSEREHSFAEMIVQANALRKGIKAGEIDPYAEKAEVKKRIAEREAIPVFSKMAQDYMDKNLKGLSNAKHRQQWVNTLEQYAYPAIGKLRVDHITNRDVAKLLKPLWAADKYETAERLLGRIDRVMVSAVSEDYIADNPISKAVVYELLGAKKAEHRDTKHHVSLPYAQAPALFAALQKDESGAGRCLLFTLLTAVRSNEARGARWGEFDLDAKRWTVPGDRMKLRKAFEVALSEPAIKLIESMAKGEPDDLVFKAARGGLLYDTAPSAILKDLTDDDQTVHGLRATFRTWAAETRAADRDVIEFALAHKLPDVVEASYQRSQLFELRLVLMNKWSSYLEHAESASNVVLMQQHAVNN